MKKHYEIPIAVVLKRFRRRLKSKAKRKAKRSQQIDEIGKLTRTLGDGFTSEKVLDYFLPVNLKYIVYARESQFSLSHLQRIPKGSSGNVRVPKVFSIRLNPDETYSFLASVLSKILFEHHRKVTVDYSVCERADIDAQLVLDVILKDLIKFLNRRANFRSLYPRIQEINGMGWQKNEALCKMLFSIGSPALFGKGDYVFDDVVKLPLCEHNRNGRKTDDLLTKQKEVDTTKLVEYVNACLARVKKELTPTSWDSLATVIGEILANAEEHSTTNHRFAIGYFQQHQGIGGSYGIFNLAIMNFGDTIYQKFKDKDCPNPQAVESMKQLSNKYTEKGFFKFNVFEEETLWTLYALQDGVTSIAPGLNVRRGHGSIQFIDHFLQLKGERDYKDAISVMWLLSGKSKIVFDGKYRLAKRHVGDSSFNIMSFNEEGTFDVQPDRECVTFTPQHFPGTIIAAQIVLKEDDLRNEEESR